MSDTSTIASVEVSSDRDTFTVESNSGATSEAIKENLSKKDEPKKPEKGSSVDPSKAASELGKLGGKAAAEKRAAEAKEVKKQEKQEAKTGAEKEPEGDEKLEAGEKPLGKPKHDPRARMLEATRDAAEAKRALTAERAEKERDRQEMQRLRAEFETLKRGETPKGQEKPKFFDPSKPRAEDFDDYEEYLDAREEWQDLKRSAADRQRQQYAGQERVLAEAVSRYAKKVTEAGIGERLSAEVLELKPVFELEASERPTGANFLASAILANPDAAPGLLVHFSENPEDLGRISALTSVHAVLREVGRIEAKLEGSVPLLEEREREVSKAPHPVKPIQGGSHVPDDVEYTPGMNFDRYAAARMKQIRSR